MEAIGYIVVTLLALYVIAKLVFMTLFGVAFAGWKNNMGFAIGAFIASAGIAVGWWFFVGTNIHVSFG
jgi:hypothetical protein